MSWGYESWTVCLSLESWSLFFPKTLSSGSQLVETFKININKYLIFLHNFEFTSNGDITDSISCSG